MADPSRSNSNETPMRSTALNTVTPGAGALRTPGRTITPAPRSQRNDNGTLEIVESRDYFNHGTRGVHAVAENAQENVRNAGDPEDRSLEAFSALLNNLPDSTAYTRSPALAAIFAVPSFAGSEKIDDYNLVQCLYDIPSNRVHQRCKVTHDGQDTEENAKAVRRELNMQQRYNDTRTVKRPDMYAILHLLALGIKNCNLEENMATRDVFSRIAFHTKCASDLTLLLGLCVYMAMGHTENLPTKKCPSIRDLIAARGDEEHGDAVMDWFFGKKNTMIKGNVNSKLMEVEIKRSTVEDMNLQKALENKITTLKIRGTYSFRGLELLDNDGASLTPDMVSGMHFPMLLLFTCIVPSWSGVCNSQKRYITEEEALMLECCPKLYKNSGSDMLQIHFLDSNSEAPAPAPGDTPGSKRRRTDISLATDIEGEFVFPIIPVLKKREHELVESVLNSNTLLPDDNFVIHQLNTQLAIRSLDTLRPRAWLNDVVINVYLQLLIQQDDQIRQFADDDRDPSFCFDSHFYNNLVQMHHADLSVQNVYDYSKAEKWSQKTPTKKLFDLHRLFIPINYTEDHWACAVVDFEKRSIKYLNSYGTHDGTETILQNLLRFLSDEHRKERNSKLPDSWRIENDIRVPQQENSYDCGVYCCAFVDLLLNGHPLDVVTPTDIDVYRERIALALIRGSTSML
jgi:hypothetical protein